MDLAPFKKTGFIIILLYRFVNNTHAEYILTISRYRDMLLAKGADELPVLSRFYGIVIRMYFLQKEHNPPHIHAIYGDDMAAITIADGTVLEGALPYKTLELVREWISLHRDELLAIWETQDFKHLPPLE